MQKNLQKNITDYLIFVAIIIFLNIIATQWYFRIDLTEERRYTLHPIVKEQLRMLDDVVYVQVYLEGDLPPGFSRLQKAIREQLIEYKQLANKNIEFEFINPSESTESSARENKYKDLVSRGLQPVTLQIKDKEGENTEKVIFPGLILQYHDYEIAINILKDSKFLSTELNLLKSLETFDYEMMLAIKNLSINNVPKIAFLEGHGEYSQFETGDITKELSKYFRVDRGIILKPESLLDYKAVIIAGPQQPFSEFEKFALDQYLMHG